MKRQRIRGLTIENNKVVSKNHCRYCRTTENLTIDHMIPKIQGGKNEVKNYQCLCQRCNGIKSNLSHKQMIRYFNLFLEIQKGREKAGKKVYSLR